MTVRIQKNYAKATTTLELPKLIDVQLNSFVQFKAESLTELFQEISPIVSYNGDLKLYFPCDQPETEGFDLKYWFEDPKYSVDECVERDMSYAAPLYVRVLLYRQCSTAFSRRDGQAKALVTHGQPYRGYSDQRALLPLVVVMRFRLKRLL